MHLDDVEIVEVGPGRKMLSMGWGWSWSDKLAYLEEKGFTCEKHGKSGKSWVWCALCMCHPTCVIQVLACWPQIFSSA